MRRLSTISAILVAAGGVCHAAPLYRVAGVVTDVQTAQPLRHAEVYIYRTGGSLARPDGKLVAGDDGRFSFDLPEGAYVLVAGTRSAPEKYGARSADSQLGSAVITGPGKDTSHLEFNWYPPSTIAGRVVNTDGDPVEGALVQLTRSGVVNGRRVFLTSGFERTNDLGEYRFTRLPAGSRYYIEVSGTPWYAARIAATQPGEPPAAFTSLWYPNAPDAAHAVAIAPLPGEEKHADFALTPANGASIKVRQDAPPRTTGTVTLYREGIAGNDTVQESQNLFPVTLPEGVRLPDTALENLRMQTFTGIPPGRYKVEVRGRNGTAELFGRSTIDVNGTDVMLEVAVRAGASVSGTVAFPDNARPPGSLNAGLMSDQPPGAKAGIVGADGTFRFAGLPAGAYRPFASGIRGMFIDHYEISGAPVRDGRIQVNEGDDVKVQLFLSNQTGRLSGFVVEGDRPLSAVMAVLVPKVEKNSSPHYGYQTESDGSFDFEGVPAGEYYFFAVEEPEFEYANPEVFRDYFPVAKTVVIEAGKTVTERIPLVALSKK